MGQRSILIQYESSTEMFRSRITKQKLKGVSGCRFFCELLRCQHVRGGESRIRNCQLSFAPRNVFGPRRCWRVLNRSGNTKRGSKGVGGCWENWDLLCSRSLPPILSRFSHSQFSRQPLVAFEPRFDFQDRLNTLDRLHRKKTFRGVNPRPRFPRQVASCHAVNFLGYFRLSQQEQILFEFSFVILDQFDASKQSLESKIFSRAI